MKFFAAVLVALVAAAGPALAQGANSNPVPGSVWTYLGATYGAGWSPGPLVSSNGAGQPGSIAVWNGTSAIYAPLVGDVYTGSGAGNRLAVGRDAAAGYPYNGTINYQLTVIGQGTQYNALIAQENLNVPGVNFSTALVGYNQTSGTAHGDAFGAYSVCEEKLINNICVSMEIDSRNLTTTPPDNFIPSRTDLLGAVADGLYIDCTSAQGPGSHQDCNNALTIGNESYGNNPSSNDYLNGVIVWNFRNTAIYVKDQPSGTQTSADLRNNGAGVNLYLRTMQAMTPANAVLVIADMNGNPHGSMFQNGDFHGNSLTMTAATQVFSGLATGSAGKCVGINPNGSLYISGTTC